MPGGASFDGVLVVDLHRFIPSSVPIELSEACLFIIVEFLRIRVLESKLPVTTHSNGGDGFAAIGTLTIRPFIFELFEFE